MTAPTAPTPRDICALDVPLDELRARIRALPAPLPEKVAEQRHTYHDLDTDSTWCLDGFVCVNCPPGGAR